MTEGKHTSGPWTVGMASGRNPNTVFAGEDGIASVFGLPLHSKIDELDKEWHQQPLANARLIAAAPDLLEACEAALAAFDGSNIRLASEHVGAVGLLRDALSKAKAQGNQS